MNRQELLDTVKELLQNAYRLHTQGAPPLLTQDRSPARTSRAHGYVDGYMQCLVQSGICTTEELKQLIEEQRNTARRAA